ncbi:aromatic motif membrane protein [Metamycoplasma alkalescens]|uniref:aromatic motif membrane protein n=1 Tax=Metamycoplasma alkalescens TaxID=45363 RepID=UPI003D05026B
MKKLNKKNFFLASFLIPILPTAMISCQQSNQKINEEKLSEINIKNYQQDKWDIFLKYEYVNSLLNLAFKDNEEEKKQYIEQQKEIINEYFEEIKTYLYYANNIISRIGSNDNDWTDKKDKVIAISVFDKKLDELYEKNWLWFLFNLDKFIFVNYNAIDQYKGNIDDLNVEFQRNSLNLGTFNQPKTNEILQFTTLLDAENKHKKEDKMFLLTKEGIILEIKISTTLLDQNKKEIPKEKQKHKIAINTYSYIYPKLFNNQVLLKKFDLSKYVQIKTLFENSRTNDAKKTIFDAEWGGSPLSYTIVDIDNKK